jgi:gluconolactonase
VKNYFVDKLNTFTKIKTGLEKIDTQSSWAEGPLWIPHSQTLMWSDIPNNRILQYRPNSDETSVYRTDVEFVNGRTLDLKGNILQCSHGLRRIERDIDGVISNVVNHFNGARFNSPNDLVVGRDGSIWFTDPHYGISVVGEGHPGVMEYADCFVFSFDPRSEKLRAVITDMEEPNGLAFSPDGSILYVSDSSSVSREDGSGNRHIRAYDVINGKCKNGRTFATITDGVPDGIKVDHNGNIWSSSFTGVIIFNPKGELIGRIFVPERVANLCFGGPTGQDVFIAASTSIYRIPLNSVEIAT